MRKGSWPVILIISFFLLTASLFLLRQPVLDFAINKVREKFDSRYKVELKIGEFGFSGVREVYIEDVSLIPANGDTLLSLGSFRAKLSLSRLLRLQIGFRELWVENAHLRLVKRDSTDNFSFLLKRDKEGGEDTVQQVNAIGYNERFLAILENVNRVFDERIEMKDLKVSYTNGTVMEMVKIPELFYDGNDFKSSVVTSSQEGVNLWMVNGVVKPDDQMYTFHLQRSRGDVFALPFLDLVDGFKLCMDSARVQLEVQEENGLTRLQGHFDVYNLLVNHWRIAPGDVRFPAMEFAMRSFFDTDSLGLDTGTVFSMGRLPLRITASYSRSAERMFRLNAGFTTPSAQGLFDALPQGMFSTLKGFKASGNLDFNLATVIPLDRPGELVFEAGMKQKNFRVERYGSENFSRIAGPFSFLAMDGDRPLRSFSVGPDNPSFTPLPLISPYLQAAVLTAEDPGFMQHNGFVAESFRESIATNIRQGRFARGGSTISMQLVKNVFLSRNKSVSRKLEEILIVWLIEQNRLLSKERMLEVYLNIIEWGPNVYGIGEASRFYFSKSPAELDLAESIFLSSLIPSPKYFRYRFDANGALKPYLANFFKLVSGRLVHREKISQAEADSLQPVVRLQGPALQFILPADTVPADSLLEELSPAPELPAD